MSTPKQAEPAQPTFSLDDLKSVLTQISEQNREALVLAITELKKPTADEQVKLDKERELVKRKQEMRRIEAIKEEAARLSRQKNCAHKRRTMHGVASAWGGQVNGDGYVRFVCNQCQMVAPEVKAPVEWLKSGVNAQTGDSLLTHLTLEQIIAWHRHYGPKPQPQLVGVK